MGFGWQELLVILVIVALIFGTKKLRNIGSDLGGAVKSFKNAVSSEEPEPEAQTTKAEHTIDSSSDNYNNNTATDDITKVTEKTTAE